MMVIRVSLGARLVVLAAALILVPFDYSPVM